MAEPDTGPDHWTVYCPDPPVGVIQISPVWLQKSFVTSVSRPTAELEAIRTFSEVEHPNSSTMLTV